MEKTFIVTRRGPKGEPHEIQCVAHPGCTWRMQANGPKADDDPVFLAQFRNHLEVAKTPDVQAFGHSRRSRV